MNRHHPYGQFDPHSPRRGNNSPGPANDRGHRYDRGGPPFRGRGGFNRGRGGYNNYDNNMGGGHNAYDQGHPPNDMGGYGYDHPAANSQGYYQNHPYADSTPAHFPPAPLSGGGYNQDYPKYEGVFAIKIKFEQKV